MKIESSLKHFSPKTMNISDTSRATASDGHSGTDLMAAIGMCQSKAPFGVAAVLAKSGISPEDKQKAVQHLMRYARDNAPKLVVKAAGSRLPACLCVLSKLAFEEYARSAASRQACPDCNGRGLINGLEHVMVHPGCGSPESPGYVPPKYRIDSTEKTCVTCHGKGTISARCRCNGSGRVRDIEASKVQGCIVEKKCERCEGRGFKRMPGSKAYRAVKALLPDLQERTWNRNWRPFFEKLVAKLDIEENYADVQFRKITK